MFQKIQVFLVEATTGCSCCSYDNFLAGPFRTKEEAKTLMMSFSQQRRLASQYSENGVYNLQTHEADELPDGRLIIKDRVWGPDYEEKKVE